MNQHERSVLRELQSHGVQAIKKNHIGFNSGSETHRHAQAKTTVGHILLANGYRVNGEVEVPAGEIDVLAFGNPERLTYAIELENSPTPEVKASKRERYVDAIPPIDDMLLLNLNEMPENRLEALEWASSQVGLEP